MAYVSNETTQQGNEPMIHVEILTVKSRGKKWQPMTAVFYAPCAPDAWLHNRGVWGFGWADLPRVEFKVPKQ